MRESWAGSLRRRLASCRSLATAFSFAVLLAAATSSLAAGNVVEYTYDAAGNITQIARQSAAGFAVTSVSPSSGAVGDAVTIYGTGFSATPASNTVKLNGVTATVTAAGTASLGVTVPTGATTERVTVTVGGITATAPATSSWSFPARRPSPPSRRRRKRAAPPFPSRAPTSTPPRAPRP